MEHIGEASVFNSKTERELAMGSLAKLFGKYAIPSVIGLLFVGLQTVIDGIILGNFLGPNALASVSLILPCYNFMASVAIVVGIGCQTMVSIRLGQQNVQGAHDSLRSAFVFLLGFSIFFSVLIFSFARDIAALMGANEVLIEGSVEYIRSLIPFLPVMSMLFLGDYMLKATGRPMYSMLIMSSSVILNIILDLLFVGVLGWGISGAGFSTGIAFSIGTMCSFFFMWGKKNRISILSGRFNCRLLWNILYNGSSEGVSEFSSGICIFLFNITIMRYLGEQGVAAFTAMQYLLFIGVTIFLGISDGVIPIVSFNYGAMFWDRIKSVFFLALRTNLIIGILLFCVLIVFGEQLIALFFDNNADEVVKIAKQGMSIYAFAFLLNGFNILAASFFTALGDAKTSIIISLLRGFVLIGLNISILPLVLGVEGIWLAVPLAELLAACSSFLLIWKVLKKIALLKPRKVVAA